MMNDHDQSFQDNPYQPPAARVAGSAEGALAGALIDGGRRLPAGRGSAWWVQGWRLFAAAPGPWIGATVVFMLISLAANLVPLVGTCVLVLQSIFLGGIYIGCAAAWDGEGFEFRHLFAGFDRHAGQLALVGLFFLLGVVAVFVILIVLLLLFGGITVFTGLTVENALNFQQYGLIGLAVIIVLTGVFLIALMVMSGFYWFAPLLVVQYELSAWPAMRMSFTACLRNMLPLLVFGLIFVIVAIIAAAPLLLGYVIFLPVSFAALYASGREIFDAQADAGWVTS
jgi:hypothetical protein